MSEDTPKTEKIKLSLNNLILKKSPSVNNEDQNSDKLTNPKLKTDIQKSPAELPGNEPAVEKNISNSSNTQMDTKLKISIKKPQLLDIKLKVNQEPEIKKDLAQTKELSNIPPVTPAYARGNIPDRDESLATSTSLKLEEDIKGKTQKIVEEADMTGKKNVLNLSALRIDLNKESTSAEPKHQLDEPPAMSMPDIDFDLHSSSTKSSELSDTIKLKIKDSGGNRPFNNIVNDTQGAPQPPAKENKTVAPPPIFDSNSSAPKSSLSNSGVMQRAQVHDDNADFSIPKNVVPNFQKAWISKRSGIIIGILVITLIVILYFMVTTIRTLAS